MKTRRAATHVRRGAHHVNPTTALPCVVCGRNVPSNQVTHNRAHTPTPLYDNLCKEHASALAAKLTAVPTPTPTPVLEVSNTDE